MEAYTLTSPKDDKVFVHVSRGHFAAGGTHINYYVGTSDIKHNHRTSNDAAKLMAEYYVVRGIEVDTVLCLYETQALGAYLGHELARPSMMNPNPDSNVYVLGPEYDPTGNIIFRDNLIKMIDDKKVLILISCITTGRTCERAIEGVDYYGGRVVGITAAFSATDEIDGIHVNSIFTKDDIPGYKIYRSSHECPLCAQGVPIDAISNGYGYSRLK